MFSYVLTEKGFKKYIPGLLTIVLTLFSGSRAGFLIIFIQAIAFGYFLLKRKKYQILFVRIVKYSLILIALVFIFKGRTVTTYIYEKATSFEIEDDTHAISNKSRFGIQYALYQVFLQNPVFGVGLGQQTFVSKDFYPDWATEDNWEFRLKYLNEDVKSFPPGYNIYLRIMAELGIVGLVIFLFLLIAILYVAHKMSRNKDEGTSLIAIVVFVSILGVFFNWLKMDTFRAFNFWINFALLLVITKNRIKFNLNDEQS
jgi:O-antigen ligase